MLEPGRKNFYDRPEVRKGCFGLLGIILLIGFGFSIGLIFFPSYFPKDEVVPKSPDILAMEKKHGLAPAQYNFEASIDEYLKSVAKDPDSVKVFAYSKEKFSLKDGWMMSADFGARNGFGGMNREIFTFAISNGPYHSRRPSKLPVRKIQYSKPCAFL